MPYKMDTITIETDSCVFLGAGDKSVTLSNDDLSSLAVILKHLMAIVRTSNGISVCRRVDVSHVCC